MASKTEKAIVESLEVKIRVLEQVNINHQRRFRELLIKQRDMREQLIHKDSEIERLQEDITDLEIALEDCNQQHSGH